MNDILSELNSILAQWKKDFVFYERDKVQLLFSENWAGVMCFNYMPLCLTGDLRLESAKTEAERISFRFDNARSLTLHIAWPNDQTPYVKSVFFGYYFLPSDHNPIPDESECFQA